MKNNDKKDNKENLRKTALASLGDTYISSLAIAGIAEQNSQHYGAMFTQGLYAQALTGARENGISADAYEKLFLKYTMPGAKEALIPERHKQDAEEVVAWSIMHLKAGDVMKYIGANINGETSEKLKEISEKYVSDLDDSLKGKLISLYNAQLVETKLREIMPTILDANKKQRAQGLEKILIGEDKK